jgi:hypothetical protein
VNLYNPGQAFYYFTSYAVGLVPTLRVGTSASVETHGRASLQFHFSTPDTVLIRTRSVRAAFPRGAWEREAKIIFVFRLI